MEKTICNYIGRVFPFKTCLLVYLGKSTKPNKGTITSYGHMSCWKKKTRICKYIYIGLFIG